MAIEWRFPTTNCVQELVNPIAHLIGLLEHPSRLFVGAKSNKQLLLWLAGLLQKRTVEIQNLLDACASGRKARLFSNPFQPLGWTQASHRNGVLLSDGLV